MNKNVFSQLAAEFDRMERTIAYQKEVISAMQKTPVCPCCKVAADGRIYAIPDLPKMKLDDCSWAEIAMYAQSGMADKVFLLGDTKKITLADGSEIHVRIIDFNHDEDDTGSLIPISFESVETLNEDHVMNDSYTNKGGWEKSKLRSVLNGNFFNTMLPDDLKAVIKPCEKLTRTSGADNAPLGKTIDHIFVLSEQEIYGRKIYSGGHEGFWYEWYRQEDTEYGKCKQNGERDWRWERSPCSGDANFFCRVYSSGNADNSYASNSFNSFGVSFGFCV